MKKRVICILLVCLVSLSSTAFATKWVNSTDFARNSYFDVDSVTKQGYIMNYWRMLVYNQNDTRIHYSLQKVQVDLRAPRRTRGVLTIGYDVNGRQIGNPNYSPTEWCDENNPTADLALPYAKDAPDFDSIPPVVSDRY